MINPVVRRDLEARILSTCLFNNNAYGSICNILKPINFWFKEHREVFATMAELWPNIIDYNSVLAKNKSVSLLNLLHVTPLVHSQLLNSCFKLLEIDISEKFVDLLINEAKKTKSGIIREALKACINGIQVDGEDIFIMLDATHGYLSSLDAPEELCSLIADFISNVDKGICEMKRAHQFEDLLASIIDISGKTSSPHNISIAQELGECIAALMLSAPVNPEILKQVLSLKKQILNGN